MGRTQGVDMENRLASPHNVSNLIGLISLIFAVISVIIFTFYSVIENEISTDWTFVAGQSFVHAIFIGAIFAFLIKKFEFWPLWVSGLVIIGVAIATGLSANAYLDWRERKILSSAILEALAARDAAFQISADALKKCQWDDVLSPKRLKEDTSLVQAKSSLSCAKRALEESRKAADAYSIKARSMLDDKSVSPILREEFMSGFDESFQSNRQQQERVWGLQKAFVEEVAAMVALLDRAKGDWVATDQQIEFSQQADLDEFSMHQRRLTEQFRELEKIEADQKARLQKKISEFENM